MWNKALDDVHSQAAQRLIIDKDELRRQATTIAKEAYSKSLREVEEKLRALGEHWKTPCIFLSFFLFSFKHILYYTFFLHTWIKKYFILPLTYYIISNSLDMW